MIINMDFLDTFDYSKPLPKEVRTNEVLDIL